MSLSQRTFYKVNASISVAWIIHVSSSSLVTFFISQNLWRVRASERPFHHRSSSSQKRNKIYKKKSSKQPTNKSRDWMRYMAYMILYIYMEHELIIINVYIFRSETGHMTSWSLKGWLHNDRTNLRPRWILKCPNVTGGEVDEHPSWVTNRKSWGPMSQETMASVTSQTVLRII